MSPTPNHDDSAEFIDKLLTLCCSTLNSTLMQSKRAQTVYAEGADK